MRFYKMAAALLAVGMLIVPASAHGGHCRTKQAVKASACAVQGCPESGSHWHNGTAYIGHQPWVYQLCAEEGCAIAGRHFHDGLPYCGAEHIGTSCDGTCQTRLLCTAEDCTMTGHHQHSGENYCGAIHAGGWCDGSCQTVQQAAPSTGVMQSGHHYHHGGHH